MVVSEQTGTDAADGSSSMKDAVATHNDVVVGEPGTSPVLLFQPENIASIEPKDGYRGILKKGPFEGSVNDSPVSDDTSYRDNYYIIPVPCQITWTILSATDEYVEMDYTTPDGTYAYIQVNKETGAYHIIIKSPDGSYIVIDADPTKGTISEMYYDANGNPVVGSYSTGTTNFWTHLYTITNNLICKHFMTAEVSDSAGPGPVQGVSAEISTFPTRPGNSPVEPKDGFRALQKDGIDVGPLSGGEVLDDTSFRDNYYIVPVPCQVSWTILSATDEYVEMDYTAPDGTYVFIRIDKETGAYHIIIKSPDGSFTVIDADPITGMITSTTHNPNGFNTMSAVADITNFWTTLYTLTKYYICDTVSSNVVSNEELEYKIDTSGKASVFRFEPGDSVPIEPGDGFVTIPKDGGAEEPVFERKVDRDNYYIIPVPCQITWKILSATDDYVELEYTAPDGTYAYIKVNKKTGAYYILIKSLDGSYIVMEADPTSGEISTTNYDADGNPVIMSASVDTKNFWTYLYSSTKAWICDKTSLLGYAIETEPVGITGELNTQESRSTSDGCKGPDLMVTDLSFPERASAGEEITLAFTVINNGNSPSPKVPFRISLPRLQTIDPLKTIPALNPDETTTITTNVVIPIDGDGFGQLRIIIDPDDSVSECNELDNSDGDIFTVLAEGVTPEEYDRLTTPPGIERTSSGVSSGGGGIRPIRI